MQLCQVFNKVPQVLVLTSPLSPKRNPQNKAISMFASVSIPLDNDVWILFFLLSLLLIMCIIIKLFFIFCIYRLVLGMAT